MRMHPTVDLSRCLLNDVQRNKAPYSIILPFVCVRLTFQHHKANISLLFCISTHERTANISSAFCVGIWDSTQLVCKRVILGGAYVRGETTTASGQHVVLSVVLLMA